MSSRIVWPMGKAFAFSIFDDTDRATLENTRPVYEFLRERGLRITKSVWPIGGTEPPAIVGGTTCEDSTYVGWLLDLQKAGFEIGYHNATYHSSKREDTRKALDRFRELFGHDPRVMANHTLCRESIYWGANRVSGARRAVYNLLTRGRKRGVFTGHVEGDPYFWGDLCRERVTYVRNFVFTDIDTLKACPVMPYHDPERPFVRHWFASTEGADVDGFNRSIAEAAQDRLEAEGGACIMYTHLAKRFFAAGQLNERFRELVRRLSAKNGWFVPVSTLLDHLRATRGPHALTARERAALERKWLRHKLLSGSS